MIELCSVCSGIRGAQLRIKHRKRCPVAWDIMVLPREEFGELTLCARRTGHNGCLECMSFVQASRPECPLCRAPFDDSVPLMVNHQLKELVAITNGQSTDERNGKQARNAIRRGTAAAEQNSSRSTIAASEGWLRNDPRTRWVVRSLLPIHTPTINSTV